MAFFPTMTSCPVEIRIIVHTLSSPACNIDSETLCCLAPGDHFLQALSIISNYSGPRAQGMAF
jgi:hypothetical protein